MGRTRQLNMEEAKTVLRLVGEIRERSEEPAVWRQHLLDELCLVMGVKAGFAGEFYTAGLPRHIEACGMVDVCHGDQRVWAIVRAYVAHADRSQDPVQPAIARTMGHPHTVLRPALAEDRVWYRSTVYERFSRPLGVDSVLYSHVPLPDRDWLHTLVLHRDEKDKPFAERHAAMVQLLQEELARLWDEEAARRTQATITLPPRLRQMVENLAGGYSEKQIATRLGLSRHTVHGYIKELHRRFSAASRGELLVRTADLRRPFNPRLAYETDAPAQPARPIETILSRAQSA